MIKCEKSRGLSPVLESSGADDGVSEGYISVVTGDGQYITARRTVQHAVSLEARRAGAGH